MKSMQVFAVIYFFNWKVNLFTKSIHTKKSPFKKFVICIQHAKFSIYSWQLVCLYVCTFVWKHYMHARVYVCVATTQWIEKFVWRLIESAGNLFSAIISISRFVVIYSCQFLVAPTFACWTHLIQSPNKMYVYFSTK